MSDDLQRRADEYRELVSRMPLDRVLPLDDLPMQAAISEVAIPDHGTVIIVGIGPEAKGMRPVPPRHALQGAELLVDLALTAEPEWARKADVGPLASLLSRLWEATAYALSAILEHPEASHLRAYLDREVQRRVDEQLTVVRTAARERGLKDARQIINRLVELVGEGNADLRMIGLSQVYPEVTRAIGDTGTVHR
jgi:hypothetical protein